MTKRIMVYVKDKFAICVEEDDDITLLKIGPYRQKITPDRYKELSTFLLGLTFDGYSCHSIYENAYKNS